MCIARFKKQLKKKILFPETSHKTLVMCSFSLLMNAKDLSGFDVVLELILVVFLSPNKSDHFNQCKQMLLDLIESRPVIEDELEEIPEFTLESRANQGNGKKQKK